VIHNQHGSFMTTAQRDFAAYDVLHPRLRWRLRNMAHDYAAEEIHARCARECRSTSSIAN
jgi:hypothetical protein